MLNILNNVCPKNGNVLGNTIEFCQRLKSFVKKKLTQEVFGLCFNEFCRAIAKWEQCKGAPSLELLNSYAF